VTFLSGTLHLLACAHWLKRSLLKPCGAQCERGAVWRLLMLELFRATGSMGDNESKQYSITASVRRLAALIRASMSFARLTKSSRSMESPQAAIMVPEKQNQSQRTELYQLIQGGQFWTTDDNTLLRTIQAEFPAELDRLKRATFLRSTSVGTPAEPSISERLYGHDYAEINRTLVGVLALRWLWHNQYETFVGSQSPSAIVLRRKSFTWLRQLFCDGLKSPDDIYTLVVSMITNDLGKDPRLAQDYADLKGIDISKVNHDMILYHAVEANMVPALNRLTRENRENILIGIKLGSDFNFGQLAQGENAPASLAGLLEMENHPRAFEMRFMEQVLDVSGAAGHEDWTCAKKMTEPIFQSYQNVYDVANTIISKKVSLREGYDIILIRKLDLLLQTGYHRRLNIHDSSDRALMRLFCLGNTSSPQDADVYYDAFMNGISLEIRRCLVRGLNQDGTINEPAVQPTYLPAILTKAAGNTPSGSQAEKVRAISAVLRYLSRCLVVEASSIEKLPRGVTVIERDVRKITQVLDSKEFSHHPEVLDNETIPEDQVANMAPGY